MRSSPINDASKAFIITVKISGRKVSQRRREENFTFKSRGVARNFLEGSSSKMFKNFGMRNGYDGIFRTVLSEISHTLIYLFLAAELFDIH